MLRPCVCGQNILLQHGIIFFIFKIIKRVGRAGTVQGASNTAGALGTQCAIPRMGSVSASLGTEDMAALKVSYPIVGPCSVLC